MVLQGCSVIWSYIELFGEERLQRAVFVDQAPLQNVAPDWKSGSKGCYDIASLRKLQEALHTDMLAFAKGVICFALQRTMHTCQAADMLFVFAPCS